ncbi:MAG: hypothetical protein A2277_20795 [Desulfobacterales bacterium RIFOXYA12_FULL_46_15]|nr:MAG: hypothetical protein A2277_20795 [Desulfobacterales bacterium RIFOXYA12_FULL_46_15]
MAKMIADLGQGLMYVVLGVFFIWLVKKVDDWRTREFDDDIEIDNGNVAVGLRRAGLYLGIAVALCGAMGGTSNGFFSDLFQLMIDGLIITGFMFSSRFVNDYIMLGNISNDQECVKVIITPDGKKIKGNSAVGMVEAGMSVATGFILNGAISGTGGTFIEGIASAVLFFILGQIALLLFGFLYQLTTPFNVRNEIQNNNLAAGIGLGGTLMAFGIILMASLSGPFTGWAHDTLSFCLYTVYGIILLLVFKTVVGKLLLPTTSITIEIKEDRNIAAMIVVECAMTAVAIIIAFSM